jgi:fumarate hydratase subunit alpha
MRYIDVDEIRKKLTELILRAVVCVTEDCEAAIDAALNKESGQSAKFALEILKKNFELAKRHNIPACQDTGMAVVFLEIGQDVVLRGRYIEDAINGAVRDAYSNGYFRKSTLDPITRVNFGDNTPAVIHTRIVKGDKVSVYFIAKGFGSENMSRLYMLRPSDGTGGIKECVKETVRLAGANPCPPVIVGVGVGGTADKAAELSKRALLRKIGSKNDDDTLNKLETELLGEINALKIGAQGFKGDTTALAVFIEKYPTHIAALPVAVNIQCHCHRAGGFTI